MTSTLWSEQIQSPLLLDVTRQLRFCDARQELIVQTLRLRPGMTILDVGCGPGTITGRLATWLGPESQLIGVDQDVRFIGYAQQHARRASRSNCRFVVGDALALPVPDAAVDACVSHSVIEHVPNRGFLQEQQRVCRRGSPVAVMIPLGQHMIVSETDETPPVSEREHALWTPIHAVHQTADRTYQVGTAWSGLAGLPRLFQELGFREVRVDALALPVVVDDARHRGADKHRIIEAQHRIAQDQIVWTLQTYPEVLPAAEVAELQALVDQRFTERHRLVDQGRGVWDYRISVVLSVCGLV